MHVKLLDGISSFTNDESKSVPVKHLFVLKLSNP